MRFQRSSADSLSHEGRRRIIGLHCSPQQPRMVAGDVVHPPAADSDRNPAAGPFPADGDRESRAAGDFLRRSNVDKENVRKAAVRSERREIAERIAKALCDRTKSTPCAGSGRMSVTRSWKVSITRNRGKSDTRRQTSSRAPGTFISMRVSILRPQRGPSVTRDLMAGVRISGASRSVRRFACSALARLRKNAMAACATTTPSYSAQGPSARKSQPAMATVANHAKHQALRAQSCPAPGMRSER
jgi:hypothetical protein